MMLRAENKSPLYCALLLAALLVTQGQLNEGERMRQYKLRNYTYPPQYRPDTPGWERLMSRRLRQLEFVQDTNKRYNAYVSTVSSAYVAPNFTENGWGLTRAPQGLVDELKAALHEGMAKGAPLEKDIEVIEGDSIDSRPWFVDTRLLNRKAMDELKPLHEAWSGESLVGAMAYGLRVYRNDSHLNMHVDKAETHIISCILHIDHDDDPDSEPWPIVIEDFQGNTNEVNLESGDMLFYESSKCLHGRPRRFKGKWYSSVFVHYYPVGWETGKKQLENHYGVPQHWGRALPMDQFDVDSELAIVGTSVKEPGCKDNWCALADSVKLSGPAKYGEVITAGGAVHKLDIPSDGAQDEL